VSYTRLIMLYVIVGLGNPGEEYKNTRHNVGRIMLEYFRVKNNFSDWVHSSKANSLYSKDKIGKHSVELLMPEGFMNNSGKSINYACEKHNVKTENIIVVYDDIDLPLGIIKISFNRGSGGHKGVESVIKSVKTKAFIRLRVGVAPVTPSGKTKKPKGEQKVLDFLMGEFKPKERDLLKKISKEVKNAIETIITKGKDKAMGEFN